MLGYSACFVGIMQWDFMFRGSMGNDGDLGHGK